MFRKSLPVANKYQFLLPLVKPITGAFISETTQELNIVFAKNNNVLYLHTK